MELLPSAELCSVGLMVVNLLNSVDIYVDFQSLPLLADAYIKFVKFTLTDVCYLIRYNAMLIVDKVGRQRSGRQVGADEALTSLPVAQATCRAQYTIPRHRSRHPTTNAPQTPHLQLHTRPIALNVLQLTYVYYSQN